VAGARGSRYGEGSTVDLPRIVVTGASGFVGRHLVRALMERYRIVAIGRRAPRECGAPEHPNVTWYQVDIGDRAPLARVFEAIRAGGGARVLVHLAAHYDFTGEEHPSYRRTNVEGLGHVLELSHGLGLELFVFASSIAACAFPPRGGTVSEASPADGVHIYAVTKRIGERMVADPSLPFRTCTARLAALFSDWCECPPLYVFLNTWLSGGWNARILAGRGESAVPYLHVRDAVTALALLVDDPSLPSPGELFMLGPDGATTHRELFETATREATGRPARPLLLPKPLCRLGIALRCALGDAIGVRPFERPWMGRYIDQQLAVDARQTRRRLGWEPRPRLAVLRRLPFLLENMQTHPVDWHRLNLAAMRIEHVHTHLRIHYVLELHEDQICREVTEALLNPRRHRRCERYEAIPRHEHDWYNRLALHSLMSAIRTREKGLFMSHCRDLAERRREQGFRLDAVRCALELLNDTCIKVAAAADPTIPIEELDRQITATVQFGLDELADIFEQDGAPEPRD
jgi:nucleoside-diphosphate-sugar epimerase